MSKADLLGAGTAFGAARGARSSRRNAIDKTIGGEQSGAALTELPVTLISENPDNPRNHLRALEETVESVRELGVILPIVVATVEAYLHDRPDRASDLDDGAQYVVVDGHRRLEASRRVGLAMIPVRVDNARVATDESLLEAAFVANYHRDDMTDLEEAHALKQLVDYYGSQTKASKRLGIAQGTLSSKLSLLKLTPELQKDLATGVRKVEHVRNLGKLSPDEQVAKADERAQAPRRDPESVPVEQSVPVVPDGERSSGPADYHGVIIPGAPEPEAPSAPPAAPAPSAPPSADAQAAPTAAAASTPVAEQARSIPEPRETAGEDPGRPPKRFPYNDGWTAAQNLIHNMPDGEFDTMVQLCLEHQKQRADADR